ncbi:MAG: glycosyltransferase, partial [Chitinophagaceae bacterium]|nr:glycosyltransferase [Chitinophagaceae bacterium]
MNIVFFAHPAFLPSQSMPRYVRWLSAGMKARGHQVTTLTPSPLCYNWPVPSAFKKWMGYIDQYVRFPAIAQKQIKAMDSNTLFVFADHALGPWVHLANDRPHVIHCHDFLAQQSALGQIPEVRTGLSGRLYQSYIRKGFRKGKNFISISEKTKEDLQALLERPAAFSEVIYNGLTQTFAPAEDLTAAREELSKNTGLSLGNGYLLHVGGNQWYKNRKGVIEIYDAWRNLKQEHCLPLLMVGNQPTGELNLVHQQSAYKEDIHFLTGRPDSFIKDAYAAASLLIFPSLAEGFGWPAIEAMASGCPVLATNERPMSEVAGDAAIYIAKRPMKKDPAIQWAKDAATKIDHFFSGGEEERRHLIRKGMANV